MNLPHAFGVLDWTVLAVYGLVLLGIGYHFSRQQRTEEEYFLGSRNVKPFLAGISLFAAISSILTYIGTPGEYISYGPVLACFTILVSLPFIQLIVGRLLIPVIMRLPITSVYELLEARLGLAVRRTGSLTFMISRFVWMSLILYVSSEILISVIGCDPRWGYLMIFVIGLVTTTYTLIGGIRTVMVTEALQFFIMLLGAILTVVSISIKLGGVTAWIPTHWEPHWQAQPFFSLNPHIRVTLLGSVFYMIVGLVCQSSVDQAMVQRFLTTRDAKTARRAFLLTNIAIAVVSVILSLVGAAVLAFYRHNSWAVPNHMSLEKNGDMFFPLYISQFLPPGVSGLLVASLMAIAMGCLSAGISALITIITKDFIEVGSHRVRTEAEKVRLSRWLALIIGVAMMIGSIAVGSVRGNILEMGAKTVNLLGCPLFGLFFLAIFIPFSTPFGAIIGAVYSSTAAIAIGYWDVLTGLQPISFILIGPLTLVVTLISGVLLSLLPTRGRPRRVIAAYSVATLVPMFAVVIYIICAARQRV